jgi:hypothetical protein
MEAVVSSAMFLSTKLPTVNINLDNRDSTRNVKSDIRPEKYRMKVGK